MNKRLLNAEQLKYLTRIARGRQLKEITALINKKYCLQLTESQVKSLKKNHKINSGRNVTRTVGRLLDVEQEAWLRKICKGKTTVELCEAVRQKYGIIISPKSMKGFKSNHGINSGLTGYFPKGHIPANKGKKLTPEQYEKARPTMFKPGQMSINKKPIGSERLNVYGYIDIKTGEPNIWRPKHRVLWEKEHGPIPEGMVVVFADNNPQNLALDNLRLVTRAELLRLNRSRLISKSKEITDAAILLVKNINALTKIKKQQGGGT